MDRSADEQLELDLLRRRDPAAFTRFVRAHERIVLGLCQSLGLSAADRDDAAAEAFAEAWKALPGFRGDSELATWLYRIAHRTIMKVRRRYAPLAGSETTGAEAEAKSGGPDEEAQTHESHERLWAAVAKLDQDQAAAIELYYRREMSIEQVAAIMNKPQGTIKTLLHRGREQLRQVLALEPSGPSETPEPPENRP